MGEGAHGVLLCSWSAVQNTRSLRRMCLSEFLFICLEAGGGSIVYEGKQFVLDLRSQTEERGGVHIPFAGRATFDS